MIVLGSTGSIGQNTLAIAKRYQLDVEVMVAGRRIDLLNKQLTEHTPNVVVIANKEDIAKVNHPNVKAGEEAIIEAIHSAKSDLVVNALVGFMGLRPTLEAIKAGKRIALANKESLVAGGAFVDTSNIVPIDSEHFGLWYLQSEKKTKRMVITASGGAFRDWPLEKIKDATLADTQKHPNWSMGQKITIDSATMMNKLFELLEARWLFGEGEYDAIIETQSIIHALIDYVDGSTTAHIAHANMQLPIAYAIRGKVEESILEPVDLVQLSQMEFRAIDEARYPIWEIKKSVLAQPEKGLIINAANEAAIEKFITGKCGFSDISQLVIKAFNSFNTLPSSVEDIFILDKEVRNYIATL